MVSRTMTQEIPTMALIGSGSLGRGGGEQNDDPRGSDDGAGWQQFPRTWRHGSVTMISRSSPETSWQWCECGGTTRQRSHRGTTMDQEPWFLDRHRREGGGAWRHIPRWWFSGPTIKLHRGGGTVGMKYDLRSSDIDLLLMAVVRGVKI
jgi:hypothetical protein